MSVTTSAAAKCVRCVRRGPLLVIQDVSPGVLRLVQDQLTYNYLKYDRQCRPPRMRAIPTECFSVIDDPDGLVPRQIHAAAGYYARLRDAFRRAGYRVFIKDGTPAPAHPEAYVPQWDALQGLELRPGQGEILEKMAAALGGRICCATGWGKSWLLGAFCRLFPRARIDISTYSNTLVRALYSELAGILPSVGLVTGGRRALPERVMCYSGKSLHHADGKADFLLIDECHEWATPDFLQRLARYEHSRNFGFSANAEGDRPDKADFELEGVFGRTLFDLGYAQAVQDESIVQIRVRWLDLVLDLNPCADVHDPVSKLRWGIWRNRARNELLTATAREYLQQGLQVLLAVDTVEHALFLRKLLPEAPIVYAAGGISHEKWEKYLRWRLLGPEDLPMTDARLRELTAQFESGDLRVAIANSVWSRGVNFRQLNVLIRADAKTTPIADKQLPGRLSRTADGKDHGLLVDCNDQFDSNFHRRAGERKRRYQKLGWDQFEDSDASRGRDTRHRRQKLATPPTPAEGED